MLKKFSNEEASNLSLADLLENSNLPGPRGNLQLLYQFTYFGTPDQVAQCLKLNESGYT